MRAPIVRLTDCLAAGRALVLELFRPLLSQGLVLTVEAYGRRVGDLRRENLELRAARITCMLTSGYVFSAERALEIEVFERDSTPGTLALTPRNRLAAFDACQNEYGQRFVGHVACIILRVFNRLQR